MPAPDPAPADEKDGRQSRRTQDRSGETRARLVACAIESISELGYTGATTPVIAERAGVSRGALQYHFLSRADLDVAIIDHVMNELNFRVDAAMLAKLPLPERVEALIERYWEIFSGPSFRAALNIWLGVVRDPAISQRLRDHLSLRQSRIEHAWQTIFKDTGRTAAELTAIRHVVMGAARGHAIERFFHPNATGKPERAVLREMTVKALQQGTTRKP